MLMEYHCKTFRSEKLSFTFLLQQHIFHKTKCKAAQVLTQNDPRFVGRKHVFLRNNDREKDMVRSKVQTNRQRAPRACLWLTD